MSYTLHTGNCLDILPTLPDNSAQCCITSPPYYGLRDYGHGEQIGLEEAPEMFIDKLVEVFREVRRVLKSDGTLWVNMGDSYAGSGGAGYQFGDPKKPRIEHFDNPNRKVVGLKSKDLIGIPWMLAFALRADGWYLRQDIIWHKPNPMPESVKDRCTKSHEYIFLLSKNANYYCDMSAVRETATCIENRPNGMARNGKQYRDKVKGKYDGNKNYGGGGSSFIGHSGNYKADGTPMCDGFRNKRSVWSVTTKPFKGAHFATYPPDLIEPCILAGSKQGDIVLDPFSGAGTTGIVALKHGRKYAGIDLNSGYNEIARARIEHALQASKTQSKQQKLYL